MADTQSSNNHDGIYHLGFNFENELPPQSDENGDLVFEDSINIWCEKENGKNLVSITLALNECPELSNNETFGDKYKYENLSIKIGEEELPRLAKYLREVAEMLEKRCKM
jgi:hypothetical protein